MEDNSATSFLVTGTPRNENDQFVGIYACQIKPTSLLTSFLKENKRLGIIDLTTLEFHPIRQRPEKRLARYLSLQWFIRLSKRNLTHSFSVKTLVNEIDFAAYLRGPDIHDRFIKALNELKLKGFIKDWYFTEEVDYSHFGNKSWLPYFLDLKLKIIPSNEIIEKNEKKLSMLKEHYKINQSSLEQMFSETIDTDSFQSKTNITNNQISTKQNQKANISAITAETLTPEMIIEERNRRKLSLLKASEEIGIGYNTLKRFEKRLTKRRNNNNDKKMAKWLIKSKNMK